MPFDHKTDAISGAGDLEPGGRAPGKQTRTGRLPATGLPLVDRGPLCEQPGMEQHAGCVLSERERVWLMQTLSVNAFVASDNQRDAIQDSRIDRLASSGPGWGFLEEILFLSVTGYLIGPAVAGARVLALRSAALVAETPADALALRIAKIDEAALKGVITNASKGLRNTIRHMRTSLPEGQLGKAAFLQVIREGIGPMTRRLVTELPTAVDDQTLIAVTLSLGDDSLHGVSVYAQKLDEICSSFDDNRLDDVGRKRIEGPDDTNENQRARLVWVTDRGGRRRLAIFGGRSGNDLVRFVDEQWHKLAVELFRDRAGREPEELRVDGFDSLLQPGAAVEHTWLDSFLGAP